MLQVSGSLVPPGLGSACTPQVPPLPRRIPAALPGPDVASLHGGYQAWPRGHEWDHLGERDRAGAAVLGGEEGEEGEEGEDDNGHRTRSLREEWTWLQPMAPGAEEVAMRGPSAIPVVPRKGSCSGEKEKKKKNLKGGKSLPAAAAALPKRLWRKRAVRRGAGRERAPGAP